MTGPDGFVMADGHRLEVRRIAATGPATTTLVLLHQGLGCAAMWRDFPDRLAERTGCQTIVYSRYGYGGSDVLQEPRRPGFLTHEGVVVLPQVLRALALDDVILVGHSDGGTMALAYAGSGLPCRALAVVAPHVRDELLTRAAIVRHKASWAGSVMRERLARYHADVDRMFHGWADLWLSSDNDGWSIEDLLAGITRPVLAIQGVQDDHGTMMQVERVRDLARGPVELEAWDACGHDPFRDQPERMLARLAAFVTDRSTDEMPEPPRRQDAKEVPADRSPRYRAE